MKVLTYGTCINWEIVQTDEGNFGLRCSSTGLLLPLALDHEGGLVIPATEGLIFKEEASETSVATTI